MNTNRDEQVRQRAYRIWEAEGRPDGMEADHWARAERELAAEKADAAPGQAPRRRPTSKASEPAVGVVADVPVRKKAPSSGPKAAAPRKKKV